MLSTKDLDQAIADLRREANLLLDAADKLERFANGKRRGPGRPKKTIAHPVAAEPPH